MIDVEQMFDGFLASFVFQCNEYNILGKKAYEMKYCYVPKTRFDQKQKKFTRSSDQKFESIAC